MCNLKAERTYFLHSHREITPEILYKFAPYKNQRSYDATSFVLTAVLFGDKIQNNRQSSVSTSNRKCRIVM